MRSMTGYGEASGDNGRYALTARLRAVNHRYLDLVLRLPDELRGREGELRHSLADRLERGRVELAVELRFLGEREASVTVERAVLDSFRASLDELAGEGLEVGELRLADLVRVPDLFRVEWGPPAWRAEDDDLLRGVVGSAAERLQRARADEGERIGRVLGERLTGLAALARRLSERREEIRERLAASLRQRIEAQLEGLDLDPGRLLQEVAVLAEKGDVAEELDRLVAHLEAFRAAMGDDGAVGKRLDFLAQEIFRELNTLGSKCRDTPMAAWVVDAKLLCEQLREQVQNVE